MATKIPIINPIRFQRTNRVIDYANYMPQFDLMRLGENYQRGIYATEHYISDYRINTTIAVIIQSNSETFNGRVLLPNGSFANMTKTQITPASWVGDDYYKFSYTLNTEGVHQIFIDNTSLYYTSDLFYVSDLSVRKDTVEVRYRDIQNRLSGYWYDESSNLWNPKAYYTGQIVPQQPENEVSVYEDDGGVTTLTRSIPKRIAQLRITEVHMSYLDVINFQLQCSDVFINGIKYTAQDIALEEKEKSDLINVTAKLTQSEDENGYLLT